MEIMMNLLKVAFICLFLSSLSGCYSVTLRPQGETKLISAPTKETSYDFFFWGLAKKYNLDGKALCPAAASTVRQIQIQNSLVDGLLTVITLGIYAPRSVSVWCN